MQPPPPTTATACAQDARGAFSRAAVSTPGHQATRHSTAAFGFKAQPG